MILKSGCFTFQFHSQNVYEAKELNLPEDVALLFIYLNVINAKQKLNNEKTYSIRYNIIHFIDESLDPLVHHKLSLALVLIGNKLSGRFCWTF